MITDDNLLCCLLPNKCNLYGQSLMVHIFHTTFYTVNFFVAIFILTTAIYNLWQIWNYYIQNTLSDIVCQNDQNSFDDVKGEDCISSKNSSEYTNIKDTFDIIGISQCQCDRVHVINNCENSKSQRSLMCKNTKSQLEFKKSNCSMYKATNKHSSKICSNHKGKIEDMSIKLKCSTTRPSNMSNERFCVATCDKKYLIKGDKSNLSQSCWSLIKKSVQ